jgi:aryl-alcohol dehydrogenase-like predicted oxidoreductase
MVMRECLANGFLSGAIQRDTVFDNRNINAAYDRDEIEARVGQIEKLSCLVRRDITSLPQAALRWVLDQPHTGVVLSGAKTRAELADAIRASTAESFTTPELETARAIHHRNFSPA